MSANAEQFFAEAEAYIGQIREALAFGRETDLKRLDRVAAHLNKTAKNLGGKLYVQHEKRFRRLAAELEEISGEMQRRRGEVAKEMRNMLLFRQAGIAYLTTDASDKH